MKKSLLKFLFPLAIFMMLVVVSTASQSTGKMTKATTTATLSATSNPALMACCATTSSAIVMLAEVFSLQSTKEVADKESADLVKYGMAKKLTTEMMATNLTAGQNQARKLIANSLADGLWVSRASVSTYSTLTGLNANKTEAAAITPTTT